MLEKFFKLSENGTDVRTEDRCRYYNIHDNGVYPSCQSKYHVG